MTPKLIVDLSESGCRKPKCKYRFDIPNRHHLRHEKTWLNLWDGIGSPRFDNEDRHGDRGRRAFLRLKERYHQFRPQDVVLICERHHAEVHDIYRSVIRLAQFKFGVPRELFTVKQAMYAMRECKKACKEWLSKQTPGYNIPRARARGKWR